VALFATARSVARLENVGLTRGNNDDKDTGLRRSKPCLVSCSALKTEVQRLVKKGDLDADLIFVSKFFHGDYAQLEKSIRAILERAKPCVSGKVILVYGDLCLGPNDEMKNLADQYGATKVDAVNCVDCLLGGRGKFFDVNPAHKLLFLTPGMIEFYMHLKNRALQEGIDEDSFKQFFAGLHGILLLDSREEVEKNLEEIEKVNFGLPVLEKKKIRPDDLKLVILEAMERSNRGRL